MMTFRTSRRWLALSALTMVVISAESFVVNNAAFMRSRGGSAHIVTTPINKDSIITALHGGGGGGGSSINDLYNSNNQQRQIQEQLQHQVQTSAEVVSYDPAEVS